LARIQILTTLGLLGSDAKTALPAVIEALKDRDPNVRLTAAATLQRLGGEVKPTLPVLLEAVKSPDQKVSLRAHETLRRFGTEARGAGPALLPLLADQNPSRAVSAAETLARVDPDQTERAIHTLLRLMATAINYSRIEAAAALWELEHPNPRALTA